MILQEINHKMPIYKDCTLGEILLVGGLVFITEIVLFSGIFKLLIGFASVGVALTFMTFFHVTKLILGKLQKIKYGKPYAFYKHLLVKKLSMVGIGMGKYVTRTGRWSTRRIA